MLAILFNSTTKRKFYERKIISDNIEKYHVIDGDDGSGHDLV